MIPIDSQALEDARRILGLGGSGTGAGAGVTEFDDGLLQQVFDAGPVIRRGRTPAGSEGIFSASLTNNHIVDGILATTVDPYNPGATTAGYPSPVPQGFDFYLLRTFVTLSTGGFLNGCMLRVVYPFDHQAFGDAVDMDLPYAMYNAEVTTAGIIFAGSSLMGTTNVVQGRPLRIGRRQTLEFVSEVTGGALGVACRFLVGLFPSSLGQDVDGV